MADRVTPEQRVGYEQGYGDGEGSASADYYFALTEHGGMDDDADTSPDAVAKEMADLREHLREAQEGWDLCARRMKAIETAHRRRMEGDLAEMREGDD